MDPPNDKDVPKKKTWARRMPKKRKGPSRYVDGGDRKQSVNRDAVDVPTAARETETTADKPDNPYKKMRVAECRNELVERDATFVRLLQ